MSKNSNMNNNNKKKQADKSSKRRSGDQDSATRVAELAREGLDTAGMVARTGITAATDSVEAATAVVEELLAGFDTVTKQMSSIAVKSVDAYSSQPKNAEKTEEFKHSKKSENSYANDRDRSMGDGTDQLVGQVLDLAEHVVKIAADASARLLEVGVGPIESFVDPDTHSRHEPRLTLKPVRGGHTTRGTFSLDNTSSHDSTIGLVLTNPLASMRGTIPVNRVIFDPSPANVPEDGSIDVTVEVKVPSSTPSGRYLGIVRSDEVADLTLILAVDVI